MVANNDAQVRVFDAETFASLNTFSFNWSVNVSAFHQKLPESSYFFSGFKYL
jgi:hypothetical protein